MHMFSKTYYNNYAKIISTVLEKVTNLMSSLLQSSESLIFEFAAIAPATESIYSIQPNTMNRRGEDLAACMARLRLMLHYACLYVRYCLHQCMNSIQNITYSQPCTSAIPACICTICI